MKIVVDSAIPYLQGILEPYAEAVYIRGLDIDHDDIVDADAMIIRTRTWVNKSLLEGTKVKFIATATIGTNHIDLDYCAEHGIEVCSAPGCNARGVLQWVAAALHHIVTTDNATPDKYTLGVVGVGNVGSLVSQYARHWGFKVMECDPPRAEREGGEFYTFEQIVENCDIITLHVPLNKSTRYMINVDVLERMPKHTTIINAARGGVVVNRAVMYSGHRYIFDVWESEPELDPKVVHHAMLGTPHIAGYSAQGKANATARCVNALAEFFDLPIVDWYPEAVRRPAPRLLSWEELCQTIVSHYDIAAESEQLKMMHRESEQLRDNYTYREEYF